MDDLQPMRPVRASPDEPRATPIWQLVAVVVFVFVAGAANVWFDGGRWWEVALSVLLVVTGVVVFVVANMRVIRENRGLRIPLFYGSPPVRPRRFDLLNGVGPSLAMVGAIGLGQNIRIPWPVPLLVVASALILVPTITITVHNRRLTTTSDA